MFELKIGTELKCEDTNLIVAKNETSACIGCYFVDDCPDCFICSKTYRSDKTSVIFKPVKLKLYLTEQDVKLLKQIIKDVEVE